MNVIKDLMSRETTVNSTDWQYSLIFTCSHIHGIVLGCSLPTPESRFCLILWALSPSAVFPPPAIMQTAMTRYLLALSSKIPSKCPSFWETEKKKVLVNSYLPPHVHNSNAFSKFVPTSSLLHGLRLDRGMISAWDSQTGEKGSSCAG